MLQSLGVSGSAEALYMLLAPLDAASETELAELATGDPQETAALLVELQDLGLARPTGSGAWEPLPLLAAVVLARTDVPRTPTLLLVRHGSAGDRSDWDGPDDLRPAYEAEFRRRLAAAYPTRDDGTVLLPFRRVFAVARKESVA